MSNRSDLIFIMGQSTLQRGAEMSSIYRKYTDLHTQTPRIIFYEYLKLSFLIYTGCMAGSVGLPYLLGDQTPLNQVESMALNYMWGTLAVILISLCFTFFKRFKAQP